MGNHNDPILNGWWNAYFMERMMARNGVFGPERQQQEIARAKEARIVIAVILSIVIGIPLISMHIPYMQCVFEGRSDCKGPFAQGHDDNGNIIYHNLEDYRTR